MARPRKTDPTSTARRPPALTAEEREDQLISYAYDLAEKQLIEGTASPSVIAHYLRLGSTKERLEKEKLIEENKLLKAKTEALHMSKRTDELYRSAIDAMRVYSGNFTEIVDDYDEYD